jgi:protease II
VWRHTMGTPQSDDVMLYEETDQLFVVHMSKSDSDRFIFVTVRCSTSNCYCLQVSCECVMQRCTGASYSVCVRKQRAVYMRLCS